MSPLTKLFVVLLVVLALLTTSATVVFVTQTQDFKTTLKTTESQLAALRSEKDQAIATAAAAREEAQRQIRETQQQAEAMRQANAQRELEFNRISAELAKFSADNAMKSADLTRVTAALTAAQDQVGKQAEMITALRTTNDERLKQNVELNTAVTELTERSQVLDRELRFANEQLSEAKGTVDRQGALLRDAGISPKMAAAAAPGPINGVIRATRNIAGIPYATISVGSNDGVAKGMKFNIVERGTGNFLGILTVDSVEQTESTGRLEGPKLASIKPGVEVKTQL